MISPEVDSRGMRYRLLYDHSDFLGETRAFDGIQLFLPYQLPQQVRWQAIDSLRELIVFIILSLLGSINYIYTYIKAELNF